MIPSNAERCEEAAAFLRERTTGVFPTIAVVLGSGLGAFADTLAEHFSIPYGLIPHFPATTVAGHRGFLAVGTVDGVRVAVLEGRFHFYEGHDLETTTRPIRVLRLLGVETLILTAAAGGIAAQARPDSILAISDHLNLLGANPLRGPNMEEFGVRFPDMSEVYSQRLRTLAHEEAVRLGIPWHEGVYACMAGPSYETPAEIRALRVLGADIVGMSLVPEAIVARHAGIECLGLAVVTNWAAGISPDLHLASRGAHNGTGSGTDPGRPDRCHRRPAGTRGGPDSETVASSPGPSEGTCFASRLAVFLGFSV